MKSEKVKSRRIYLFSTNRDLGSIPSDIVQYMRVAQASVQVHILDLDSPRLLGLVHIFDKGPEPNQSNRDWMNYHDPCTWGKVWVARFISMIRGSIQVHYVNQGTQG
jgi:hypothetical protein